MTLLSDVICFLIYLQRLQIMSRKTYEEITADIHKQDAMKALQQLDGDIPMPNNGTASQMIRGVKYLHVKMRRVDSLCTPCGEKKGSCATKRHF